MPQLLEFSAQTLQWLPAAFRTHSSISREMFFEVLCDTALTKSALILPLLPRTGPSSTNPLFPNSDWSKTSLGHLQVKKEGPRPLPKNPKILQEKGLAISIGTSSPHGSGRLGMSVLSTPHHLPSPKRDPHFPSPRPLACRKPFAYWNSTR